jgi:hypothetical protein
MEMITYTRSTCMKMCLYIFPHIFIHMHSCVSYLFILFLLFILYTGKNGNDDIYEKYIIAPRMFKQLIGKDHREFSSSRQQAIYFIFTSSDSASLLLIGHLFLIIIDVFLYLCLSGWSFWKRMV